MGTTRNMHRCRGCPSDVGYVTGFVCSTRRPDDSVTEGEIGDYLRSCLPRYKVPKVISFFEENEFPSTVSGKVNVGVLHSLVVQRLMESEIDIEWKEAFRASGGPLLG